MRIMIVDDHSDMRRVLMNIVSMQAMENVEFIECDSGEDAVTLYENYHPDCVLMDFQLGKMDGLEASERIISADASANVVLVTSYDTPTIRNKAKSIKVKGFVSKENLYEVNDILQSITINQ